MVRLIVQRKKVPTSRKNKSARPRGRPKQRWQDCNITRDVEEQKMDGHMLDGARAGQKSVEGMC